MKRLSITRLGTSRTSSVPPVSAGFALIRTTPGTVMRNADKTYVIAPKGA